MDNFVYIVGNKGNMGRRYAAVLRYLKVKFAGHDKGEAPNLDLLKQSTHIIIATPTDSHLDDLATYLVYKKPILCEKPFTKMTVLLERFEADATKDSLALITMVNQYAYMVGNKDSGDSSYDYFKSGSDGKEWDCINIIGMAKGSVKIATDSPIWSCTLNGKVLSQAGVDVSYIDMMTDWLKSPKGNWSYAKQAHYAALAKVIEGCS